MDANPIDEPRDLGIAIINVLGGLSQNNKWSGLNLMVIDKDSSSQKVVDRGFDRTHCGFSK